MSRKPATLLAAAGVAVLLLLGANALRQALSPLDWARAFARNPFALTTRATPTGPVVLQQIQRLQRVETCRYNGQVVVRGDTKGLLPTWLAGDRMLFVGQGEVVAGIDLSRLSTDDVQVQQGRVAVRLPEPEVFHTRLDNHASEVYERQTGLLTGPDRQLEKRVRVEAEDRIRAAALDHGVLATAETNAQELLRRQLGMLGFREVEFL